MPDVKYNLIRGDTSGIDNTNLVDGQILFDKERHRVLLDAYVDGLLTRIVMTERDTFNGTTAQWNALSDAQKSMFTYVNFTDDYEHVSNVMVGATASTNGTAGIVPRPMAGDQGKVLFGNGEWGNPSVDYNDLSNKPTLGSAAALDVPSSGDASSSEVVLGTDSRLTDSRNALDVYSWAKAANKPTYTASEVGAYTTTEVDNMLSTLETNITWKTAVATYADIATTYPNPQDGWTVVTIDTDYAYRYNGTEWIAISANAVPEATTQVNGLMTTSMVTKLNGIDTGAEVNQNAFSNVKVGNTTIEADSKTDTVEFVAGTNVTLTPDATNGKVTVSSSWRGIQNNLTSTSTTDSLSAAQGKVLKESIDNKFSAEWIEGVGTEGEDKGEGISPRYFPTLWTFNTGSNPVDGQLINIKIPVAGNANGVYISINHGTTYHPVIVSGTTALTTHFANGVSLMLVFEESATVADNAIYPSIGGDAKITDYSGGCWRVLNYKDTTYSKMSQSEATTGTSTSGRLITAKVLNDTITGYGYTTNTGTVTSVKVGDTSYNPTSGVVSLPDYPTNTDTIPSAYCNTAAGTAAKTATCTDYALLSKSYIQVIIKTANTSASALTLSINGKTAKPIYINGSASSSSNYTLPAGSYFVYYNGTNYYFRTDGKITGSITGDAGTVNGKTVGVDVPADAVFTDTNTYVTQSNASANKYRKVLLSYQNDDSEGATVTSQTNQVYANQNLEFNTSSGLLKTTGLSATTINGVTVGGSPKFTDTTYSIIEYTSTPADLEAFVTGTAKGKLTTHFKFKDTNNVFGEGASKWLKGHIHYQNSATDATNACGGVGLLWNGSTVYKISIGGKYGETRTLTKTKIEDTTYTANTTTGLTLTDTQFGIGTVPIANGGTGATDRLNAAKNLTNENVGTSATYFIGMTSSWGKFGYVSLANAKSALGLGSAAYTASTDYAAASHSHTMSNISDIGTIAGINTGSSVRTYLRNDGTWAAPIAVCDTASGTQKKSATLEGFVLAQTKFFLLVILNENTYNGAITLNINSTGNKAIYINGSASSGDSAEGAGDGNYTLPAGIYFVYNNGSRYYIRTDNTITGNITGSAGSVTGTVAVANGGTGKTTVVEARANLKAARLYYGSTDPYASCNAGDIWIA